MAQLTKNSDKLKAIETLIKILGFDKMTTSHKRRYR